MVSMLGDGAGEWHYIVAYPPVYNHHSSFGRAAKAVTAYDLDNNKVVFLKDYWRVGTLGTGKEAENNVLVSHPWTAVEMSWTTRPPRSCW